MFPTVRLTIACVLTYALLASTMSGVAAARLIDAPVDAAATPRQDLRSPDTRDASPTSSLAGTTSETAPQDLRSPDARDAALAEHIARAMERYYSSYGEPEPLAPPAPTAPTGGDTPWLPIGIAIAAILATVAAGGAQLRIRRRRTAGAAV
jgi:hypothetical protein